MKINSFCVTQMRQQQAFEYYNKVWANIRPIYSVDSFYPFMHKICNEFTTTLANFDDSLKPLLKSDLTEKIRTADNNRVRAWRGLRAHIKNQLNSFEEETVEAATQIHQYIQLYGNPANLAYTEKTGTFRSLISDLETKIDSISLEITGADKWFFHLKKYNSEFIKLISQRERSKMHHESGLSMNNRDKMNKTYQKMIERINALILMDDNPVKYESVILGINEVIDRERTVLKTRKTRFAIKSPYKHYLDQSSFIT